MTQVYWIPQGEGVTSPLSWKTKLRAWWEGYDLSVLKPGAATEQAQAAVSVIEDMPVVSAVDTPASGEPQTRLGRPLWSAGRIKVAETLWGQDFLSPGGADHTMYLVKPFGITSAMSVLDLAAGLGGAVRTIAEQYKAWTTGLEPSPMLAELAQARSVAKKLEKQAPVQSYDQDNLNLTRRYDCIFAKENFFTVENKDKLFDAIAASLKENGQLIFTDYCLEDASLEDPTLVRWMANEPVPPHLWNVQQIIRALKKRKLDVRTNENITDLQRRLILQALGRFLEHLETHAMDIETKLAVLDEVELWARRMAAFDAGLKVYRFYSMKR